MALERRLPSPLVVKFGWTACPVKAGPLVPPPPGGGRAWRGPPAQPLFATMRSTESCGRRSNFKPLVFGHFRTAVDTGGPECDPPIVMFCSEGRKDSVVFSEETKEFVCNLATWN